jgi:hypothetical protein
MPWSISLKFKLEKRKTTNRRHPFRVGMPKQVQPGERSLKASAFDI